MEKNIKAIMLRFNLAIEDDRVLYEKLQDRDDGAFSAASSYARYLIARQLKESDIEALAEKIAEETVKRIVKYEEIPDYIGR